MHCLPRRRDRCTETVTHSARHRSRMQVPACAGVEHTRVPPVERAVQQSDDKSRAVLHLDQPVSNARDPVFSRRSVRLRGYVRSYSAWFSFHRLAVCRREREIEQLRSLSRRSILRSLGEQQGGASHRRASPTGRACFDTILPSLSARACQSASSLPTQPSGSFTSSILFWIYPYSNLLASSRTRSLHIHGELSAKHSTSALAHTATAVQSPSTSSVNEISRRAKWRVEQRVAIRVACFEYFIARARHTHRLHGEFD